MEEKKIIIEPLKNTGFEPAEPSPENYRSRLFIKHGADMLGGVLTPLPKAPIIFPDSKGWLKVAEDYGHPELQFNKIFDTYSCVIFGIAKACCYYLFKVYGITITISEMYNAFFAGVKQGQGTTVEKGMESFRKHGWGEDKDYPFTPDTTPEQFFAHPPASICLKFEGVLTEWDFNWEIIPNILPAIVEAYKRYPVVLSGFAWASYLGDGVYYDYNNQPNHVFIGLERKDNGNNLIGDNYPKDGQYIDNSQINVGNLIKELDKSYKYGSAHVVWLTKKKFNLILKLKSMFEKIVRDIHGALWFVKEGKKQKITDYLSLAGALVDEIGAKTLSDTDLAKLSDFKFFGK